MNNGATRQSPTNTSVKEKKEPHSEGPGHPSPADVNRLSAMRQSADIDCSGVPSQIPKQLV